MQNFVKGVGGATRRLGQALESLGLGLQGGKGYKETLSKHRTLQPFEGARPQLGRDNFVAPNASLIGNVKLGDQSSVFYGAIVRGDVNSVTVGHNCNIQDNVVVHVARHSLREPSPTVIGNNVTIGHGACIHACTIEDDVLIGMGALVLDGAKVEKGAIVGAGAVVTPGTVVPTGEIWAGRPAKLLRKLEEEEMAFICRSADNYAVLAADHAIENAKTFPEGELRVANRLIGPTVVELDKARRRDRQLRDPDYDSHMGLMRDPVTREVVTTATHT